MLQYIFLRKVLGAGVAGLAAIGTTVSLGAECRAWDVRDVSDQVESMGGSVDVVSGCFFRVWQVDVIELVQCVDGSMCMCIEDCCRDLYYINSSCVV